jgi:hypothetical protein
MSNFKSPERALEVFSKPLFQQFNELIKTNANLAGTIKNEALERILADQLPDNAFKVSKYGIQILYRYPNGMPYKYQSQRIERINSNRKTVGYNSENEFQFCRYRIAQSLINASNFSGKYYSPSKHETGLSSLPFFTDAAIKSFRERKQGGTIYLCEGEIKAAIMSNNGLEAVGFGGINMFLLSFILIEYLEQRQPDHVVLIYDADYQKQGKTKGYSRPVQFFDSAARFITDCKKHLEQNQVSLPEFYICAGKDEEAGKGVDDVIKNYPDIALNALKSLRSNLLFKIEHIPTKTILPSCRAFFGVLADSRKYTDRVFQGSEGEYLTKVAADNGLAISDFKNKIIISPTGSGKSTLIRSMAAHERIVVAVPTNALQRDFEREADKNGIDCFIFNSNTYLSKINSTGQPVSDARFIITTYRSFRVLADVLDNCCSDYNLIIDEAHNFTSSAAHDFIHDDLFLMLQSFRKFQSVSLFTATDLPVFAPELQLEKWIFTIPSKIERELKFYEKGISQYNTAANMAALLSKTGQLPLIVLNSKKDKLLRMKRALSTYGTDFKVFNADTKKENYHNELLSTGKTDADCIIATSVIKEGVNIYDSRENVVLIVLSELHASELEQFAARFRLAKKITIIVLVDEKMINFNYSFSFANHANIGYNSALAHCEQHNQHELSERELLGKFSKKFTSGDEAAYFDIFTHEWKFCPLLLAHNIFKTESQRQRINPILMLQYLEKYNWKCVDVIHDDNKLTGIKINKINSIPSHHEPDDKKTTKEIFLDAIKELEESAEPITTAQNGENEFFPLFLQTVDFAKTPEKALEILKDTEGSTASINTLKRRLNFGKYLAEIMTRKNTKGIYNAKRVVYKIVDIFVSSGGLTATQVREHYLKALAGTLFFDNRDLEPVRNDRILKNLSRFLECNIEKEKRDKKTEKIYYFSELDWL